MRSGSKFLIGLIVLLCASGASALGDDRLNEAEKSAQAGEWEKARGLYSQALQTAENPSAALFYNYGTATLRAGAPGPASVLLLKAQRLNPFDADIRANLAIARAKMNAIVRETRPAAWISWWPEIFRAVPLLLWWVAGLALLAPFLWVSVRRQDPSWRWPTFAGAALLLTAGLLSLWDSRYLSGGLVQTAKVLSGPAPSFPEIGNLDAGTLVSIEEVRQGWYKVRYFTPRPQEVVGWIEAAAIQEL